MFPLVKAEAVAMDLAARVGLSVAPTELVQAYGRDVLLVERFDRVGDTGQRRMVVSSLTILGLPEHAARHATYHDLADTIRRRFTEPTQTLRERQQRPIQTVGLCGGGPIYGLTVKKAREIIDAQVDVITAEWKDAADRARLTEAERDMLWGRSVLNPFSKEGY